MVELVWLMVEGLQWILSLVLLGNIINTYVFPTFGMENKFQHLLSLKLLHPYNMHFHNQCIFESVQSNIY